MRIRMLIRICLLTLAFHLSVMSGRLWGDDSPRVVLPLNGMWQCEPGMADTKPSRWTHTVQVPGFVDMCAPHLKWEDSNYFWYQKTFRVPPGQDRKRALVRIEQSQYGSEVWLNGKRLGSYNGCYTSHEYDATDAIDRTGENTLLVRVGKKDTLPPDNASGCDSEKLSFIPGIWGDIALILTGDPRIRFVRVTPRVDEKTAEAVVRVEMNSGPARSVTVSAVVLEKKTGVKASQEIRVQATIEPSRSKEVILMLPLSGMRTWSPEDPFLYELEVGLKADGVETDRTRTTFGMRDFRIQGSDFFLNGKRVFLRGSNLAFHRFLSDPDRRGLPWDLSWAKKIMADIPKQHNFNFFRFHVGHAYNRWYDLADQYGLLIQDEWMSFGRLRAGEDAIRGEFTRWIEDNYNHPSIVIWDPMNEAETNEAGLAEARMLRERIVPEMKKLDPTRPWEFIDFEEEHPYIYSLGPVLNDARFGFARSIRDMQESRTPTLLNEFLWFWLRHDGTPSSFTSDTVLRWLGPDSTKAQRLAYQAFLAAELVEQFRRMRVDGIAPFTYLGANAGPTADWFLGDLRDARPKPVLAALGNAFSPFGVSVELWDRHFFTNELRRINVYVFNDSSEPRTGFVTCRILGGGRIAFERQFPVEVAAGGTQVLPVDWIFPGKAGRYVVQAGLAATGSAQTVAFSRKVAYVFEQVQVPGELGGKRIVVHDPDDEILDFLKARGVDVVPFRGTPLQQGDILVVGEGGLGDEHYVSRMAEISAWVEAGGTLVAVEPEYGGAEYRQVKVTEQVELAVRKKDSSMAGGYDSAVFPVNRKDPFWRGIPREHLSMFNGGFGGIIVSDYDVMPAGFFQPHARSGLGLGAAALGDMISGKGVVVFSRLQVRGRLMPRERGDDLYALRVDPVAQRYLLNLLATYAKYRARGVVPFAGKVLASSGNEGELRAACAVDGDPATRWSSGPSDPQWIIYDLGERKAVCGVTLTWEAAYGREYNILVSDDGTTWVPVYHESEGDGGVDEISFDPVSARYVGLIGLKRGTDWGYSLWEMNVKQR